LNKRPPVVLVTSCNQQLGDHPAHTAIRKYVDAVRLAGALPFIAPPFEENHLDAVLDAVDGVLLTGSPSNVHPSHFGEAVHNPALPLDPERDAWTLPLVRKTIARGQPLLAICRGTQEVNVALGGSLHQAVQEVAGHNDHRSNDDDPLHVQYGAVHAVNAVPGGVLHRIVGKPNFSVNSLHGQAIKRLAPGLRIEATSPDGVIEAVSALDSKGFALCLQWHPEWQASSNPVSMQLLQAFGQALCAWRDRVRGPLPAPAEVN
jgi:putative glutamine amidotransferase